MNIAILSCVVIFVVVNVLVDFIYTLFLNSSFYLSESLLFSSYWILFLPLLALILQVVKKSGRLDLRLLSVILAIAFHVLAYPALVWMVSKLFYSHTFSYWPTFNFGLTSYFIQTVIIYGFSLVVFALPKRNVQTLKEEAATKGEKRDVLTSILVADHNNKKVLLEVADILYFSANSPYVSIYHSSKKYLHSGKLKTLEARLDGSTFLRIHKSHILNINKVSSVQSRHNGDYDVTLSDGTVLRVSRNYAKAFKSALSRHISLA